MSLVNTPPFGLQDLLGSRNFGKNPSELVETIQPTIDMLPYLDYDNFRIESISGSVNIIGASVTIEIPDSEIWNVVSVSASYLNAFAAGASARIRVSVDGERNSTGFQVPANLAFGPINPAPLNAASTAVRNGFGWVPPRPVSWGAGTVFTWTCVDLDLNAGASVTMSGSVAFFKLST